MTLRIAISGADGFVGRHVITQAHARGHTVLAVSRDPKGIPDEIPAKHRFTADLTHAWPEIGRVDVVVHLAALAAVGPSFENPRKYVDANAAMVINLNERLLREATVPPRIILASTAALYSFSQYPLNEQAPILLNSPYAVSKRLCENLLEYYATRGIKTVVVRPFNHIGPGQRRGFIVPDLYEQLRKLPDMKPLVVGNLSTERDYTDVRDVARAYLDLAETPTLAHTVYNVASGQARSGHQILEALCNAMGRPTPELKYTSENLRPTDNPKVVGDARRIQEELGWKPRISLAKTMRDTHTRYQSHGLPYSHPGKTSE